MDSRGSRGAAELLQYFELLNSSQLRRAWSLLAVMMMLRLSGTAFGAESAQSQRTLADRRHAEGTQLFERNEPAQAVIRFSEAFLIRHQQLGPTHANTLMSLQRANESGAQLDESSRKDWTMCLPWFEKMGMVCTNSYRSNLPEDIRIHTGRLLNLIAAGYWNIGDEKRGGEWMWVSSRWMEDLKARPMSNAEFQSQRLRLEEVDRGDKQTMAHDLPEIVRRTREAQQQGIANNPILQAITKQQANNTLKAPSSAELMNMLPNDPTIRAFAEYGEFKRTNMHRSYASIRDGENHSRELDQQFAREHPEADRLMRQTESTPSPNALGNMPAREWVAIELKKWNEGLVGFGGPLGPQIKHASGPFENIPQEVERDPSLMAEMILGLKGTMLELDLRLHRARNSENPEVRDLGRRLAAVQERFDQMDSGLGLTPGREGLAAYAKARKDEEELKNELRVHPDFEFQTRAPISEVIAGLPAGTALAEYVRYGSFNPTVNRIETRYGVLVVLPEKKPLWLPLTNATTIDPLVDQYQDWMRRTQQDAPDDVATKSLLSRLHQVLWEPLEKTFSQRPNRIIVSPDGALNFLSFATLINRSGRFVAEDYSVSYVSSGRDLLIKPTSKRSGNRRMEIWADPSFSPVTATSRPWWQPLWDFLRWLFSWWGKPQSSVTVQSFTPLGGTRAEAKAIESVASLMKWEVKVRQGESASEEEFRKMQPPGILHLATHGFFIATPRSTNVFGDAIAAKPSMAGRLDPLYLSGVALKGADRTLAAWNKGTTTNSPNDGLLMAAEVSRLDLGGTWLACLSACETGIGLASNAESMRGLRTAFHVAGADNVLCSLWKVDDSFTSSLMPTFYEDALKSEDIAGALARVQAKELKNVSRGSLWRRVTLAGPFTVSSVGPR